MIIVMFLVERLTSSMFPIKESLSVEFTEYLYMQDGTTSALMWARENPGLKPYKVNRSNRVNKDSTRILHCLQHGDVTVTRVTHPSAYFNRDW